MDRTPERPTPLRGAIIGFGNVAVHAHLPVWLKSGLFTIEAVVETNPERREMARELLPEARIYRDVDALVSDNGVEFLDICTPPCFHSRLVLSACRAGLHVFCEKPLTICSRDLAEIQRAAERSGRVVFTVNNWKHAPLWLKASELIRRDVIGTVRSLCLNVLRSSSSGGGASNWRNCAEIAQGGILIDHGWHNLYLILSLVRQRPVSIAARLESPLGGSSGLEETADVVMRFEKAEARLHLTWQASCRRNYGTIVGDRGTIDINDDHLIVHARDCTAIRFDFPEALSAGSHHPEWMEPVIADFSREILESGQRGTNLAEAQWCARLIDLAYRSGRDSSSPIEVGCEMSKNFGR